MELTELKNPLYLTFLIYIVVISVLFYLKPKFLYIKNTKKFKVFGTGSKNNKTIFPLWLILMTSMIIVYSMLCILIN